MGPFGLNRWLDWGIYHAGGLDSLLGATRWVQSPAEQDDYAATELFFVRDHLGSPALAMQAKRTLVSGSTYRWELQPVESYEYAPYGDPTIHVPATDGSPQSAGRLALKELESFAMTGAKSTESLLDRNDVGRPNGSSGNTWTRSGAVPVAKSFLSWSHLFTGRPWDADVRQYNIRHRWYEPLTGRWTAVDPIGYDGGINQYQYCGGNGVNFVDPWGLFVVRYQRWVPGNGPNKGSWQDVDEASMGARTCNLRDKVNKALARLAKDLADEDSNLPPDQQNRVAEFFGGFGFTQSELESWGTSGKGPEVTVRVGGKDNGFDGETDGDEIRYYVPVPCTGAESDEDRKRKEDEIYFTILHELGHYGYNEREKGSVPDVSQYYTEEGVDFINERRRTREPMIGTTIHGYAAELLVPGNPHSYVQGFDPGWRKRKR